jgi:hypothetical protein
VVLIYVDRQSALRRFLEEYASAQQASCGAVSLNSKGGRKLPRLPGIGQPAAQPSPFPSGAEPAI